MLAAYDHRCAISNLPNDHLLDAAHIIADAHELMGQLVVANAIALSKIHHAAFHSHLIGIDPDGRVHVSERLLMLHDGPLLEQSLKACAGTLIRPPRGNQFAPTATGLPPGSSSSSWSPAGARSMRSTATAGLDEGEVEPGWTLGSRKEQSVVDRAYVEANAPTAADRLVMAGVRLGALLKRGTRRTTRLLSPGRADPGAL